MRSKRNRLGGRSRRNVVESKSAARKKFSLLARGFETLELRSLLAADSGSVSSWTNPNDRFDVNGDGRLEPSDLLLVIDNLNRVGARSLIASAQGSGSSSGVQLLSSTNSSTSGDDLQTQYLDVTGDGELTPQDALFVINALNNPPPTARFTIETLDLAGNPISNVSLNESFLIKASAQDLLFPTEGPTFEGMFSAYMDIAYNAALASVVKFQGAAVPRPPAALDDAVQFAPFFTVSQDGNLDGAGLIDEIGASTQFPAAGQPVQLVFYLAINPSAQGQITFTPQFASGSGHQVFVFGDVDTPLSASDIDFQASSPLTIGAANPAPKANITINDVTVTEGNSGTQNMTFTISLTNNNYDVQVRYATANGTAVTSPPASQDYQATSGILTFVAGGTTSQTITVRVAGDTAAEATENFFVNLFSSLNATITDSQGVGTINDNDTAGPTLSIGSPAAKNEGNSGDTPFVFPVTISANPTSTVTVVFNTGNGTATTGDVDYTAANGTLTFSPGGPLTQNITINAKGDTKNEANETFTVTLSNAANASINTATGTATINNDDALPTVSIGGVTQNEGNTGTTTFSFPVTLSAASGQQVTVVYTTSNGTASSPGDFASTTGTVTFAAGETSKNATVSVVGDTTFEPNENFTVTLSSLVNASAGTLTATGTITNDDASPVPAFSITDVTTAENVAGGTQTFTVSLSQAGTSQITVRFDTANGTATTTDNDYTTTTGTLTFAVGETSKTITVGIVNDAKNEANETYNVNLTSPTGGATIADGSGLGTINNDDPLPTMIIGDVTLAEGNASSTAFSFPVTLSAASGQQVTVIFTTSNGTATTGDNDYGTATGTLTFAPNQTSKNITVNVTGDTKNEANETFNVTLSGGTNVSVTDSLGLGTITNDDAVPNVTITNVTLNEGNSGTTNFVFAVSLSAASGQQVTVPFSTTPGSATSPADFATTSGVLTFAPSETSKTITVAVVGDLVDEAATETFTVNLGTAVNANVTAGTGTGTIQDDDGPPGLSIADLSQNEGNSGSTNFNFVVTLAAPSAQQVTVVYTTSIGSATLVDNDFATTTGTLTFAPNVTSQNATVVVNGDTKNEANETFTVTLSSAVNSDITDGIATGTITNDDPQPSLTIGDVAAKPEGNASTTAYTFPVTLSAASGQQVTVAFTATAGTATSADGDFAATSGILTFAPGETSKNVTVNVNGDTKNEANETFTVVLSGAVNASISDGTGASTINNDDPVPDMSIAGVTLTEGNTGTKNFGFNVTLSAASGQPVTVVFATANGTATAGSDYATTSGTLTFAPGETSKTINVAVNGDTLSEFNESFTVNLTGAVNANVTASSATGTITNDDQPPGLSIGDVTLTEGNAGTKNFTFTVSLAQASGVPITVDFATGGGNATAGTDYTATSGVLTFAAGETSKSITVLVNGDLVNEADETFNVTLSNASGSTPISIPVGIGTITNDDVVNVTIGDASQNEGNTGTTSFTFNVTLSASSDQAITIPFSTSGGTATAGADFASTSGTLTFAAGETSKQVTVAVNGDTTFENNESFQVNLSTSAAGVTLVKAIGAGSIVNDDAAPTIAIGDIAQLEGTVTGGFTNFVFNVTVTGATELPLTVVYTTADGTAITGTGPNGRDYNAQSGTLTFAAGETNKTVTVQVRADRAFENDETFSVDLSAAANATIADNTATATIQNDDPVGSLDVSTLAGYVFVDTNNNGIKDAVEKPLAGVKITLDGESDAAGTVHYETITGADGTYKLEDLDPGDYVLAEVQPGFYLDGIDHVGTQGAVSIANDAFTIRLEGGVDVTGNIFAERGLQARFISKRLLVASTYGTGQGFLSSVNLSEGAAWLSVDGGIDGTLTVEADGSGAGSTTLTLYDNNLTQVATSTGTNGDLRVDWTGTPGAPYFIRVSGSNTDVDVRLTNLVDIDIATGIVTVQGTSGDDNFVLDPSGSVHTFTINGVKYELNPANASRIVFEGGAGNDHVTLIDSAFDERLTGSDDWLSVTNNHGLELTAYGIESARAEGTHGGNDVSDLVATDFALQLVGDWA